MLRLLLILNEITMQSVTNILLQNISFPSPTWEGDAKELKQIIYISPSHFDYAQ